MLPAAHISPIPYEDPWKQSFEDRLIALSARERRIAYFYEKPDTTTFRYRVFNMVEALNAAPELGISASWFTIDDLGRLDRFIDQADALVICRVRYDSDVNRVFARARARGIPVLFDIDDLVFDGDYTYLIIDSLDLDFESQRILDSWFSYTGRLGATLRLCDGAITTSHYLAERINAFFPRINPRIVPNFLNRIQQARSEAIWDAKLKSNFERDDRIHIGYFSGTPTHNHDFRIVSSALAKILDEDSRVIVRVVGFLRPNEPIFRYGDRIEFYPLQDFLNLQRLIGEVELNIAPLQNNVFSNCKSELKYFEAAIVGTLTIASPTFTFRTAIRDGQNGFLCGAHEWDKKLRAAIDIVYDLKQYTSLISSAYRHAQVCYGWNCQAARIAAAVFGEASEAETRDHAEIDSASRALGDGRVPEKYRLARTSGE